MINNLSCIWPGSRWTWGSCQGWKESASESHVYFRGVWGKVSNEVCYSYSISESCIRKVVSLKQNQKSPILPPGPQVGQQTRKQYGPFLRAGILTFTNLESIVCNQVNKNRNMCDTSDLHLCIDSPQYSYSFTHLDNTKVNATMW